MLSAIAVQPKITELVKLAESNPKIEIGPGMTDVMGTCAKLTKEKKTHIAVVAEVRTCGNAAASLGPLLMVTLLLAVLLQIFKAVTLIAKHARKPFSHSARYAPLSLCRLLC